MSDHSHESHETIDNGARPAVTFLELLLYEVLVMEMGKREAAEEAHRLAEAMAASARYRPAR